MSTADRADQVQTLADTGAQPDDLVGGVTRAGRALDDHVKLLPRIFRCLVEQSGGDERLTVVAGAVLRSRSQR